VYGRDVRERILAETVKDWGIMMTSRGNANVARIATSTSWRPANLYFANP
jgi:hypothetical protein